jgi:formate dehydrogenase subunit beta
VSVNKSYIEYRSTEKKPLHPVESIVAALYKALLTDGIIDEFVTFTEKKAGGGMAAVSVETSSDASSINQTLFSEYLVGCLPRLLSIPKIIQSQLTGCFDKRVGVVAHPCETRAFVELSKRHQVSLNNLFIVGLECLGTVPVLDLMNAVKKGGVDPSKIQSCEMTSTELNVNSLGAESLSLKIGQDVKLRESCERCSNRQPVLSDILLSTWGEDLTSHGMVLLRAETERGKNCLSKAEKMGLIASANSLGKQELEKREANIRQIEKTAAEKLAKDNADFARLDGEKRFKQFVKMIEPCTKCGLCIRACPVCWCKDCILLKKVKTLDPLLLHTTRLVHMGDTCVDCGKCDENCPKGIPVSKILYGLATELGKVTGYRPGLELEQPSVRSAKFILGKQSSSA